MGLAQLHESVSDISKLVQICTQQAFIKDIGRHALTGKQSQHRFRISHLLYSGSLPPKVNWHIIFVVPPRSRSSMALRGHDCSLVSMYFYHGSRVANPFPLVRLYLRRAVSVKLPVLK